MNINNSGAFLVEMVIQWYKLQTHLLNYVQPLDMQSTFLNLFPNWQGKRFSGKNAPWHQTNTSNLSFIVCFFFRSYFKLWISVLSAWIPAVTHSQLCQICQLFKVFFYVQYSLAMLERSWINSAGMQKVERAVHLLWIIMQVSLINLWELGHWLPLLFGT